jgi:hypothetical protein
MIAKTKLSPRFEHKTFGGLSRESEKKVLTTSPERPYTKVTIRLSLHYYSSIVYHGE